MIRLLWTLPVALTACTMVAGCADDSSRGRQRPAYSYENVDIGSPQPGQSRIDERPPAAYSDPYSRSQSGRY